MAHKTPIKVKSASMSVAPKRRLIIIDSIKEAEREGLKPRKPVTDAILRRISSSAAARKFWTPIPVKKVIISKEAPAVQMPEAILPVPRDIIARNIHNFTPSIILDRLKLPPGTVFNLKDLAHFGLDLDTSMDSNHCQPEPEVPIAAAAPAEQAEAEDEAQGEKFKAECIRFLRQKITYDDMWKVHKELKRLRKTKKVPRFGGLSLDTRGLLFELFCNEVD